MSKIIFLNFIHSYIFLTMSKIIYQNMKMCLNCTKLFESRILTLSIILEIFVDYLFNLNH